MEDQTRDPSRLHVGWRIRCLLDAGLDERDANRLGHDSGCDVHALLALIDRGCPPVLAVRILAPQEAAE